VECTHGHGASKGSKGAEFYDAKSPPVLTQSEKAGTSLVKPIMTFGLPAWQPTTKENTTKLERIQKKALRFIHGPTYPRSSKQKTLPFDMQLI